MTARGPAAEADLLVIGDFRIGDTGAGNHVALVRALAEAGYRVAVLQWFGSAAAEPTAMTPGWAALFASSRVRKMALEGVLRVRLVLATDLRLFAHRVRRPLSVVSDARVAIAPRRFASSPGAAAELVAQAEEAMGGPFVVAPAAPVLRAAMLRLLPGHPLTPDDWPPVLARWAPRKDAPVERVSRPVVGFFRASRMRPWPGSAEDLRALLPDTPAVAVSVLAPPPEAAAALAGWRAPVTFHPAGSSLADFLAGVDVLVCPDLPEDDPYPEEALAALAAGTIPAVSPGYRASLFSAAIYTRPQAVAEAAIDLMANPGLAADLRAGAVELVDHSLAADRAVERVARLIGPPSPTLRPCSRAVLRPEATLLSLSTNGVGMGHLVRQLAIATRLERHVKPVFLGFSHAIGIARRFGFPSEHLPYHLRIGLDTRHWNASLLAWLDTACRFYRPQAFVLDANLPFAAIEALTRIHPGLPMIWVRRAMWGEGRDLAAIDRAELFDLVIEPGELAAAYDSGPTSEARNRVRQVPPVTLLDADEQLPRQAAAAELGIEADTLNVLVMPGARNNFDADALWAGIVAELGSWPRTRIVVCEWAIAEAALALPPWAIRRKGFPYARWFRAFDFAVSSAGYNSFAELTALGLPAVFVPNENPLMDRQDLRARFAERNGLGLHMAARDRHRLASILGRMRDPETRHGFRERLMAVTVANGAEEAANLVTEWIEGANASQPRAWL